MKTEIFAKLFKQSSRRALYWVVCILLVLTVLTSWSVSGVYAKYVDSASATDYAGVAHMGIPKFELLEHKSIDISDELDKIVGAENNYRSLYELDFTTTVLNNSYEKVIPGIDIPKDPFINLVLQNNEVNYELYIKVEESENFPEYVMYALTDDWEKADENKDQTAGLYKYVGKVTGEKYGIKNGIFVAGTEYKFEYSVTKNEDNSITKADSSIHILKGDKLKVSEHFNSEPDEKGNPTKFSLTFTAYLQQILNIPQAGSGTENDTP